MALRTQLCADQGDNGGLNEALEAMYRPTHHDSSPLRRSDGQNLLSDNSSILARWSEHFQSFFSAYRNVQDTAIHRIPHLSIKQKLDESPTLHDMIKAIAHLHSCKAPGIDGIPPEIWKFGGTMLNVKLYDLLVSF